MSNGHDLNRQSRPFAPVERLLVVETHDQGMPPTIEKVIAQYTQVMHFLNWSYNLAEALDYVVNRERRSQSEHLDRFIAKLSSLPENDRHLEGALKGIVLDFSQSRISAKDGAVNPPPEARILQSNYTNPLETLILVGAVSLVAVIIGGSVGYKKIQEGNVENAKAKVITEIGNAVSRGDDKTLEKFAPVWEGVRKTFENGAAVPAGVKFKVAPHEMSFEAGEQPA